jgi:thiamine pyrophosphokinase
MKSLGIDVVYVFNCMWGRFDQVIGNVHQLYCTDVSRVYLITEDSIIFVVKKGDHVIHIDRGLAEGHCGFFPLTGPCRQCWTTGFKWNLSKDKNI